MYRILPAIALSLTLAACASPPASIAPVNLSGVFDNTTCSQAQNLIASERNTLVALEAQQNNALAGDSIAVMIIGLPLSSMMGGDVETELAVSKGRVQALEARLARC